MVRAPRRERWAILGAGLEAVEAEAAGGRVRPTRVAAAANLPFDRLQQYLAELQAAGLLEPGDPPRLTEKGRGFLDEYRRWSRVLSTFGLDAA